MAFYQIKPAVALMVEMRGGGVSATKIQGILPLAHMIIWNDRYNRWRQNFYLITLAFVCLFKSVFLCCDYSCFENDLKAGNPELTRPCILDEGKVWLSHWLWLIQLNLFWIWKLLSQFFPSVHMAMHLVESCNKWILLENIVLLRACDAVAAAKIPCKIQQHLRVIIIIIITELENLLGCLGFSIWSWSNKIGGFNSIMVWLMCTVDGRLLEQW